VPVLAGERLLATLGIRFAVTAVSEAEATERFVPRLKLAASRIGEEFMQQAEQDIRAAAGQPPVRPVRSSGLQAAR